MADIPTIEPTTFPAGDSLSWKKSLSDYSTADGWSLLYCFRGNGLSLLDVASTNSGTSHLISISVAQSASLIPGEYAVAGYAVKEGERVQIYFGTISVTENFQTLAEGKDTRTIARRTLDKIEAVIEGRADSSILNSMVDGTRLERIPIVDLLKLRDRYATIVASEQASISGNPVRRNIVCSFK